MAARTPDEARGDKELLAEVCRHFVADVVRPVVDAFRDQPGTVPIQRAAGAKMLFAAEAIGLRAVGIPEADGGTELDAASQARCIEEIARGEAGFAANLVQSWTLTRLIARCAEEPARGTWISRYLATPDLSPATAVDTLASAGRTDVVAHGAGKGSGEALSVRATPGAGDTWALEGTQRRVRNAEGAGLFVLAAETPDGEVVVALVPADSEGLHVTGSKRQIGQDLAATGDLTLHGVTINPDHVLTAGTGLSAALREFAHTTVLLEAAAALGVAQAAFDASARYVQLRLQGGQLIINYPGIATLIARMATSVESIRAMTTRAAQAMDAGADDAATLAIMAREHAATTACSVARTGMEIHGGSGVMREMGVERHYRDAITFRNNTARDAQLFAITHALLSTAPRDYGGPESVFDLLVS